GGRRLSGRLGPSRLADLRGNERVLAPPAWQCQPLCRTVVSSTDEGNGNDDLFEAQPTVVATRLGTKPCSHVRQHMDRSRSQLSSWQFRRAVRRLRLPPLPSTIAARS